MMIHTRRETSKAAMLAAVAALALLLAGCQSDEAAPQQTYTGQVDGAGKQTDRLPDSPQKTYSEQDEVDPVIEEPHTNPVDTSSGTSAETSTLHKANSGKAAVETESVDKAWNAEEPALHGVAIGDSEAKVIHRFGKEIDSYTLDEGTAKVQVLEFDGFAIGINSKQTVQYVEIYGKNLSAGLSGLQIGDKPDAAVRLLGKPEKQTTYLIAYEAEDAMLKLDIDPASNEIVSIKLLALS